MSLAGPEIVLLGVAAVVAAAALLALLWDRTGRIARTALAAAGVLAVAATAALQVNRLTDTYPTWSVLAGTAADGTPGTTATLNGSALVEVTVPGPASGLTLPMYVYLPAAYADRPHTRFPVIEALHGYPGSPRTWLDRLAVRAHLDAEIRAGRMAPSVVLMPYQTPRQLVDTECTDLVHGPKAETFLTTDVPAYARTHLRVRTDRNGWGLIGYSAGGFCATNLALRHPGEYAAGAALSGYGEPGITIGDGSDKTTNNDLWRLTHLPPPEVSLFLAWAADDAPAKRQSLRIAALARAPLTVTTAVIPHGGHTGAAWRAMEAPAFDWLSAHLGRPVS